MHVVFCFKDVLIKLALEHRDLGVIGRQTGALGRDCAGHDHPSRDVVKLLSDAWQCRGQSADARMQAHETAAGLLQQEEATA